MGDAERSAACGEVAMAAGWTGLGCWQVALKIKKKTHYICVYVHIHTYAHCRLLGGPLSMN